MIQASTYIINKLGKCQDALIKAIKRVEELEGWHRQLTKDAIADRNRITELEEALNSQITDTAIVEVKLAELEEALKRITSGGKTKHTMMLIARKASEGK